MMKATDKNFRFYLHKILSFTLALSALLVLCAMAPVPRHTPSNYEDRIRAQFRSGHWEQGGAILDSAMVDYPQASVFYELKGQLILHDIETNTGSVKTNGRAKSYELARYYLIKCIDIDEKNLNSRRLLLRIETETQHYSSAIVYCNELLEESPYNEHLWRTKIDLYRKMGNDLEADRLLERLLTIYNNDTILRRDLAERKSMQVKQQRNKGDNRGMEESLRQLIDLEPSSADHYKSLFSLLYRTGRLSEAAELAERGALHVNSPAERDSLIAKRVSVLMEMNRHAEAQNYLNSKQKAIRSAYLQRLKSETDIEIARQARMNDPYEAYAKVYESQHQQEALNYLIGTAIQRGYHDDALYYIREARKRHDTPKLHYQEYLVLKRQGHAKQAESQLRQLYERVPADTAVAIELAEHYLTQSAPLIVQGQYAEAIPLLHYTYVMNADPELTLAARTRLLNCYIQTKQYDLAETLLEEAHQDLLPSTYAVQRANLYYLRGNSKEALRLLAKEYRNLPATAEQERQAISYAYEEIAVPYIKGLVASGMTHVAWTQVQDALEVSPQSNELLRYAISLSLTHNNQNQAKLYTRMGMEFFPGDPYFKLKGAQLMIQEREYVNSIDSLRSLLDVYPGDSTIVLAFTDCSENLALQYVKEKDNQRAMQVLDTALYFNPNSHTLLYTKAMVYRKMKKWKEAEDCLKRYKPDYREYTQYKRSLEELANQQMRNSLSLEYQQARLGSEDAITANAYISYTRKRPWQNSRGEARTDAYSVSLAYAGRDGRADVQNASDPTRGGTGILLSAAWEHQFSNRFTGKGEIGWSNRYFPALIANFSGTYDMKNEWQLTGRANFRWLKTYTGVYGTVKEFSGYDADGNPMYADVVKLTDWIVKSKPMVQVGIGANKTLGGEGRFNVGGGVDGFLLSGNIYFNANAKLQFYPLEDRKSSIFAQAGLGTAPESSLIDQSLAVGFSDLNTFTSLGVVYFLNKYITLGLTGSWYTMLTQNETLSLPLNGTNAQITRNYSNYFYIHGSLIVSF